jgi:NAD(P)-dependent dehydrogenase (short-subunit alcohol dehydrogenase family)
MSVSNIVITGSTRGVGLGMARAFLARGQRVVVCGRTAAAVEAAIRDLSASAGERVAGTVCDVGQAADVQSLWDFAAARFGRVDIWINNAGLINGRRNLADLEPADIDRVVQANVLGVMHGSRVAIRGMLAQAPAASAAQIYSFEGFGSDGMIRPGLTVYGSTKAAVRYFVRSLRKEYGDRGVLLGTINPGIVTTNLVTDESQRSSAAAWEQTKKRLRLFADHVDDVAPFLADAVLANTAQGANIRWLSVGKLLGRLALAPFQRRDPFAGMGV